MQQDPTSATIKVDFYQKDIDRGNLETYNGLVIHALPGLHQFVLDTLCKVLPKQTLQGHRALDLGCGQGALSLRLADAGAQVLACDYVTTNYRATHPRIDFAKVDLNTKFASSLLTQAANVIVAVEIAEHIENPRNFIRECRQLLSSGGLLVLTTPNIDSPRSKVDFLLEGTFHMFSNSSYASSGHITPISGWQLSKMAEESNFETAFHETFGVEDYTFKQRPKAYVLQELIRKRGHLNAWGNGAIHVMALRAI